MENILLPEQIVEAVIARLEANRELLSYKGKAVNTIKQIDMAPLTTEIAANMGLKAPWLGVFFYEDESESVLENGEPYNIDTTIGVLCSSSPQYSFAVDAVNEAQAYAMKIFKIILTTSPDYNTYFVNAGTIEAPDLKLVRLVASKIPREVMLKTSDLSLCVARFNMQAQG